MFDAFVLMPRAPSMLDARDAYLAADMMRFGGANQKEMWRAFAGRGMGDNADEGGTPDWTTPLEAIEAKVRFQAEPVAGGGVPAEMSVWVGHYSARVIEAAKTTAAQPSAVREFVPGEYEFVARANGYGHHRFKATFKPGEVVTVKVPMRKNLASATHGAEASGDGGNFEALIDDTEETNWAYLGASTDENVEGKQVTVALAGGRQKVAEIQVSAINRPQETSNDYDPFGQSRFAALRSFQIFVCDDTTGTDCAEADSYQLAYTSPEDGFPSIRPRPTSPNLLFRTFDIPNDPMATHVRLVVLTNQCTGNPLFTREENPVEEPFSDPDCMEGRTLATLVTTDPQNSPPTTNNTQKHRVRAAELQVFSTSLAPQKKEEIVDRDKEEKKPPVIKPPTKRPPATIPTTGVSPVLPLSAVLLAGAAALVLRRRRVVA